MSILISGANGFVGSHLSSQLNDLEIFDRKSKSIFDLSSWMSYGEKEHLIFLPLSVILVWLFYLITFLNEKLNQIYKNVKPHPLKNSVYVWLVIVPPLQT